MNRSEIGPVILYDKQLTLTRHRDERVNLRLNNPRGPSNHDFQIGDNLLDTFEVVYREADLDMGMALAAVHEQVGHVGLALTKKLDPVDLVLGPNRNLAQILEAIERAPQRSDLPTPYDEEHVIGWIICEQGREALTVFDTQGFLQGLNTGLITTEIPRIRQSFSDQGVGNVLKELFCRDSKVHSTIWNKAIVHRAFKNVKKPTVGVEDDPQGADFIRYYAGVPVCVVSHLRDLGRYLWVRDNKRPGITYDTDRARLDLVKNRRNPGLRFQIGIHGKSYVDLIWQAIAASDGEIKKGSLNKPRDLMEGALY